MGRRSVAIVLACALVVGGAATAPVTLARFVDQDTSTISLTTDTLAPPTGLTASGAGTATAGLNWTATNDTYATGYEVYRSTTSGSGYAQVATVTPRTTTSTTNAPGASGTYYYVLRSYFQNWRSVDSNEASVALVVGPPATGFKSCTAGSNAADTGGNGNGYESNPINACADDTAFATDANTGTNGNTTCTNTGKDRHRFYDFNLGVPGTASAINGIEVRADEGMNNNGGTSVLCVELSWNAGASWTTPKSVTLSNTTITTYAFGANNDTWGRTWAAANFTNANFRVRITDASSQPNKDFYLEYLAVQVTYTP